MTSLASVSPAERQRLDEVDELSRAGQVGGLLDRLDDRSWVVRRSVVAALARAGDAAVGPLCDVLRGRRDDEARLAAAVDALAASQGASVERAVLALTHDANPAVVCDGVQVLGRRKSLAAIARLGELARGEDDNVGLAAIEAIGRIGGAGSVDLLVAAIESGSFFRVFPAIDVLGRTGDPRAVGPLEALLDRPHYAAEAARALGRSGQPAAAKAIASLLLRPNDAIVRVAAVALVDVHERHANRFGPSDIAREALGALDPHVVTRRISQALAGADAAERLALCRVLGWLGGPNAVEGLLDLLDAEPDVAQTAALALSALTGAVEPFILAALRDSGSQRRLLLLPILGQRAPASADIIGCLEDPSPNVRALACDAIGKLADHTALPRLFTLLRDPDARVSQAAVAAIQSMGGGDSERLALEAAKSTDLRERRSALRILSYFGWSSALDVFLDAMSDTDERIRDLAALGLASLEDDRATAALVTATGRATPRSRAAAVRALARVQPTEAVRAALRAALKDPDAWVRYYACQALSRSKDEASAEDIAALVDDEAGHVRVAAIEALAQLRGPLSLEALHRALVSSDADLQRAALLGVGSVRSPRSLPYVLRAVRSPDVATRLVALSAVAEFPQRDALAALSSAASDADDGVRAAAIALLGGRPGPDATQLLIELLAQPALRDRVVSALAQPVEGRIEALGATLRTAGPELADLLVSSLARMRRAEATAVLEDAFTSGTPAVRRAIAPALAALATASSRRLIMDAARDDADDDVRRMCIALLRR